MKENEAPEKIYVSQHSGLHSYMKNNEDDIEYTRTDAFIEKAKVWLEKNADKYIWYSDYSESLGDDTCGMNDDFVKDFANYMKGE